MSIKIIEQVNNIRLVLQLADDSVSSLIHSFKQKRQPTFTNLARHIDAEKLTNPQEHYYKPQKQGAQQMKEIPEQKKKLKEQLLMKNYKEDEELLRQEAALKYLQGLGSRIRTVKDQSRQIMKNTTRLPEIGKVDDEMQQISKSIDQFELKESKNDHNLADARSDDGVIGNYELKKIQVKSLNRKYSEFESFNGTQVSLKDSCSSLSSTYSGIHDYQCYKSSSLLKLFSCSLQTEDEEQTSKSSKIGIESQSMLPLIATESQAMLPLIGNDSQSSLPFIGIESHSSLPLIEIQSQPSLPLIQKNYLLSNDSKISQREQKQYRKSKFSPIFQQATEISLFNTSQIESPSSYQNMVMATQSVKIFDQYNHTQNWNTQKREDIGRQNNEKQANQSSVMLQTSIQHQKNKSTMNCQVINERLISPSTIKQYYGQGPAIKSSQLQLDQYLVPQRQPLNQDKSSGIQIQSSTKLNNGRILKNPSLGSNGGTTQFQLKLSEINFEEEELTLKLDSDGCSIYSNQGEESSNCGLYVNKNSPFSTDEYNISPQSFGHIRQQHSISDFQPSNLISFIDSRTPIPRISEVQSPDESHSININFNDVKAQPSTFGDYVALQGSMERPRSLESRRKANMSNRSKLQSIKMSLQDLAKDLDCRQYDGSFTTSSNRHNRQRVYDKASSSNFKISLQRAN